MRFAFAGFDRWLGVFDAFIAAGWTPVRIYTIPVDGREDFNDATVQTAARHGIPIQLSRIGTDDLRVLRELDCDTLVVAGYGWKVPDWTPYLSRAVNFHPSPLPEGRGPYPLFQALLNARPEWGISCHRLSPEFDTGSVLAVETFPITEDTCQEVLQLRLQMRAKVLASNVARNLPRLWNDSQEQEAGSYWPRIDDTARTLDFTQSVKDIMRVVRACGLHECIAPLQRNVVYVKRAVAWQEVHSYRPGEIVHEHHRWSVIAARDGFVALIEWSPLSSPMRARMGP